MKTIWIVYPYGGIVGEAFLEARDIRFGRVLAEKGYKVIYWTANFSHTFKKKRCKGWKTIKVCKNFKTILVPALPYNNNISVGRVLFETIFSLNLKKAFKKMDKPDMIITPGTGLITAFYPVWPYIKENNVPTIYDIMDIHMFESYVRSHHSIFVPLAKLFTRIIERREKRFYESVDAVCGLGKNQLEVAIKRTGRKNIPSCLVYNGIYLDDFRKNMRRTPKVALPDKGDWSWCVYAGSLGPSYDIETILKCVDIVKNRNEKIRFIIAGAGPQEKIIADAAGKNDRIIFLGSLNPVDLPAIYARCDIGLCSYADFSTVDMPDKFYDYCAAGLPSVNSLQGEIKEYISRNNAGMQYEAGNPDSMYQSIRYILDHDYEKKKKNAYLLAERFDFGKQMEPFTELIDNLLRDDVRPS